MSSYYEHLILQSSAQLRSHLHEGQGMVEAAARVVAREPEEEGNYRLVDPDMRLTLSLDLSAAGPADSEER